MAEPHHFAHWYPTAAYLYVLCLDTLALAWEYLRRHPDYRLDWLRRARRFAKAQVPVREVVRVGHDASSRRTAGLPSLVSHANVTASNQS